MALMTYTANLDQALREILNRLNIPEKLDSNLLEAMRRAYRMAESKSFLEVMLAPDINSGKIRVIDPDGSEKVVNIGDG
jgi:hypothetical protein